MTRIQILAAASAFLFTFFGLVKIAGVPKKMSDMQWEKFFTPWGMSKQQVMLAGLAEWVGAAMLFGFAFWSWPFGVWGAAIHVAVCIGAIRLHSKYGVIMDAMPAMVMLAVSALILIGWPPRTVW